VNLLDTVSLEWLSYFLHMVSPYASADVGNFTNNTDVARQFLRLKAVRYVERKMGRITTGVHQKQSGAD